MQTLRYCANFQIGPKIDKSRLQLQETLLAVYEGYNHEKLNRPFFKQLLDGPKRFFTQYKQFVEEALYTSHAKDTKEAHQSTKTEKDKLAGLLLFYCRSERYHDQNNKELPRNRQDLLKEYLIVANHDPKAIESLIKILNNPTTPNVVKEEFFEVLAINKAQDQRFANKSKKQSEEIAKFKFAESDFNSLLIAQKQPAVGHTTPELSTVTDKQLQHNITTTNISLNSSTLEPDSRTSSRADCSTTDSLVKNKSDNIRKALTRDPLNPQSLIPPKAIEPTTIRVNHGAQGRSKKVTLNLDFNNLFNKDS